MNKVLVGMVLLAVMVVGFFVTYETTFEVSASHTVSIEDVKNVKISGTLSHMDIKGEIVLVSGSKENSLYLAKVRGINSIEVNESKNIFGLVKHEIVSVK